MQVRRTPLSSVKIEEISDKKSLAKNQTTASIFKYALKQSANGITDAGTQKTANGITDTGSNITNNGRSQDRNNRPNDRTQC